MSVCSMNKLDRSIGVSKLVDVERMIAEQHRRKSLENSFDAAAAK